MAGIQPDHSAVGALPLLDPAAGRDMLMDSLAASQHRVSDPHGAAFAQGSFDVAAAQPPHQQQQQQEDATLLPDQAKVAGEAAAGQGLAAAAAGGGGGGPLLPSAAALMVAGPAAGGASMQPPPPQPAPNASAGPSPETAAHQRNAYSMSLRPNSKPARLDAGGSPCPGVVWRGRWGLGSGFWGLGAGFWGLGAGFWGLGAARSAVLLRALTEGEQASC
jgi:hypothetical protein